MAEDVEPLTAANAAVALRLCNFVTGQADLLTTHQEALDAMVAPVIRGMWGPWVDLFGFASRVGSASFNQALSQRRLDAVRSRISSYAGGMNFQLQTAFGASRSGGEAGDNDGYWRAVEVYVYATRPARREPDPQPPRGSTQFEIRVVGGGSGSVLVSVDNYFFQIVDLTNNLTAFFFYTGGGVSISLPKVPGPGSMTFAGPPTRFTTSAYVELHQFNSEAVLFQDPGATIGPISVGGTFRLHINEIVNADGVHAMTDPSSIPISGGSGLSMPGLGAGTTGVLALVSEVMPFAGYY